MKTLSTFLMILATITVSAQNCSTKTEVSVDGKIFEKGNGYISNKDVKSIKNNESMTRSGNSHTSEYIYEITTSKVYLLNSDKEVKNILKNILPKEILNNCEADGITMNLRINSSGKIEHVTFMVKHDSPIYNMDINIFSKMEDTIKSTFRFHIPDKTIPIYSFTLPKLKISHLTGDQRLFPETLYKERK